MDVAYSWTQGGRTWEGNRYAFGPEATNRLEHGKRVAEGFSPGRTVTCYVDPVNPSEAVIVRNLATAHLIVGAIFCLIFTAAPIIAFSLWIPALRRKPARQG